jgi:hypothetical protein
MGFKHVSASAATIKLFACLATGGFVNFEEKLAAVS